MLKKVKLYGELGEKYGKEWDLAVESPAEAIRALCANNPGFRQFMSTSEDRGMGYKVLVAGAPLQETGAELHNPTGRQDIKIVPVILGAKSGIGQVIVGALMIYVAVMTAGASVAATAQAAAAASAGGGAAAATIGGMSMGTMAGIGMGNLAGGTMMAAKFGAALVLGGIASMMAPTPSPAAGERAQNYAFNGASNTTRQGVAIPVCYGQLMVGGAVISSGIQPEDYVPETV